MWDMRYHLYELVWKWDLPSNNNFNGTNGDKPKGLEVPDFDAKPYNQHDIWGT